MIIFGLVCAHFRIPESAQRRLFLGSADSRTSGASCNIYDLRRNAFDGLTDSVPPLSNDE